MRSDAVHILFYAIAFVVAAALQDVSFSLAGAKLPLIQAVALYLAFTRHLPVAVAGAIAAGVLFDSLTGLPVCCTSGFLLLVAFLLRLVGGNRAVEGTSMMRPQEGEISFLHGTWTMAALAPLHEMWTHFWSQRFYDGVMAAVMNLGSAAALGAAAGLVIFLVVPMLEHVCGAQTLPDNERRSSI